MLGLSVLLCIGALVLVLFRRPRHRDWDLPVMGLLTASGLALIVLPAVTAGSEVRYGVPAAPLLFAASARSAGALLAALVEGNRVLLARRAAGIHVHALLRGHDEVRGGLIDAQGNRKRSYYAYRRG